MTDVTQTGGRELALCHPDCTAEEKLVVRRVIHARTTSWMIFTASMLAAGVMFCCGANLSVLVKSGLWGVLAAVVGLSWINRVWRPRQDAALMVKDKRLVWLTGKVRETYLREALPLLAHLSRQARPAAEDELFERLRVAQLGQNWIDRGAKSGFLATPGDVRFTAKRDRELRQAIEMLIRYNSL